MNVDIFIVAATLLVSHATHACQRLDVYSRALDSGASHRMVSCLQLYNPPDELHVRHDFFLSHVLCEEGMVLPAVERRYLGGCLAWCLACTVQVLTIPIFG